MERCESLMGCKMHQLHEINGLQNQHELHELLLRELCEFYELHGFRELNAKVEGEDKYKYCFTKTEKTNKQKQVTIMDTGVIYINKSCLNCCLFCKWVPRETELFYCNMHWHMQLCCSFDCCVLVVVCK